MPSACSPIVGVKVKDGQTKAGVLIDSSFYRWVLAWVVACLYAADRY